MANHPISIESAGGEYMESVVILGWSVQPGDAVKAGQLIVTVETAKAATEIEADRDGWLSEIFFTDGQEAPLGAILGNISDTQPTAAAEATTPLATAPAQSGDVPAKDKKSAEPAVATQQKTRIIASPLARRVARATGIDLGKITGSGPRGRIKHRDIVAAGKQQTPPQATPVQASFAPVAAALQAEHLPRLQRDPVVFLHGFGADRSAWRQVLSLLPSDCETVCLDLPGHGSATDHIVQNFDEMVFDISDRLDAMGIEKAHLVGHSLGGAVALGLSSLGRLAVRSLTLLAPGGMGPEINIDFINGLVRSSTEQALEQWLTVMVGDTFSLPKGYAGAALRQMQKSGVQDRLAQLAPRLFPDATQGFALQHVLRELHMPARVIWGRADRVIPVAHSQRIPGQIATHLLDNVGHVPQMEAAELTARLILQTVKSAG